VRDTLTGYRQRGTARSTPDTFERSGRLTVQVEVRPG
jgi:hypothetical protein